MDPTLCPGMEVCPFPQIRPNDRSQKDLGSRRAHQKSGEMKECTSRCRSDLKLNIRQLLLRSSHFYHLDFSPRQSFPQLLRPPALEQRTDPSWFSCRAASSPQPQPPTSARSEEELATRGCEMPSAASNFRSDSHCLRLQPKACPMSLLMPNPPAH